MTKIRIKATGEIKLVPDYVTISVEDCDSRGVPLTYSLEDIEIVDEGGTICLTPNKETSAKFIPDFENIRLQSAMLIHTHLIENYSAHQAHYRWCDIEKMAIEKANAFIEKLKETTL